MKEDTPNELLFVQELENLGKERKDILILKNEILKRSIKMERDIRYKSKPVIIDLKLIPTIFRRFSEINNRALINDVYWREQLMFVFVILYSPKSIAGKHMVQGLRREINKMIPEIKANVLSENFKAALSLYNIDNRFKYGIHYNVTKIIEYLRIKELIK